MFLIPGNNEYYNNIGLSICEINNILLNLCNKFDNVKFLNNQSYDLDSNIRIVGSVLFNYTPSHKFIEALNLQNTCNNKKNDCRNTYITIKNQTVLLNFKLKNILFKYNVKFLIQEIHKAVKEGKKLIICTHYTPSKNLLKEPDRIGSYNFYSNLDFLFRDPIIIWLCGHSHYNIDLNMGNVLCSMNTVGHSDENTKFIKGKYIDVEYN